MTTGKKWLIGIGATIVVLVMFGLLGNSTPDEAEEVTMASTTEATTTTEAPTTTVAVPTTTLAAPTTTTTAPTTTTTVYTPTDEEFYVYIVREVLVQEYPAFDYVSDEALLDTGYSVCDGVEEAILAGNSPEDEAANLLLDIAAGDFDDPEAMAYLAGVSIAGANEYLCPSDYLTEVMAYVEDLFG